MADVHDTPSSESDIGPVGVGCEVQMVPFQLSACANGTIARCAVGASKYPTAVQAVADAHDTPPREASWVGLGAVGWIVQDVPSQCSASVTWAVPL
jgi:hypothetical protein